MEQRTEFDADGCRIEALIHHTDQSQGVVVTHPHPQFGGDMHNPVVETLVRACAFAGYATLRFNFRGVGASSGHYDEGRGEQLDVEAAMASLADLGLESIALAGYSFGAWVNAHVGVRRRDIASMIMVSPPVKFIDFTEIGSLESLDLVVSGDRDDFAPVDRLRIDLPRWSASAKLIVIPGADHFYGGYLPQLYDRLIQHIPSAGPA